MPKPIEIAIRPATIGLPDFRNVTPPMAAAIAAKIIRNGPLRIVQSRLLDARLQVDAPAPGLLLQLGQAFGDLLLLGGAVAADVLRLASRAWRSPAGV